MNKPGGIVMTKSEPEIWRSFPDVTGIEILMCGVAFKL